MQHVLVLTSRWQQRHVLVLTSRWQPRLHAYGRLCQDFPEALPPSPKFNLFSDLGWALCLNIFQYINIAILASLSKNRRQYNSIFVPRPLWLELSWSYILATRDTCNTAWNTALLIVHQTCLTPFLRRSPLAQPQPQLLGQTLSSDKGCEFTAFKKVHMRLLSRRTVTQIRVDRWKLTDNRSDVGGY